MGSVNGSKPAGMGSWRKDDELTDTQMEFEPEDPSDNITVKDLRDTNMPEYFTHFHALTRCRLTVRNVPGKLNILLSAYFYYKGSSERKDYTAGVKDARSVFLDSGCFSALTGVMRGKLKPQAVHDWVARQEDVVKGAWDMHNAGSPPGVVGVLDLPVYEDLLAYSQLTVDDGQRITLENTVKMQALEKPPGWKPVYMVQGSTAESYGRFTDQLEELGVLNEVREGTAILGVGGTLALRPPGLYTIYETVRGKLGPEGHIHALGVSRRKAVAFLASRKWIQSSDSSSAVREVVLNNPPYHISGPRPEYVTAAMSAANCLRYDVLIGRAIREAEEKETMMQDELMPA